MYGRTLDGLEPEWLSPPGRFGVAVSFMCPAHRKHRLFCWFKNPVDGWPQLQNEGEVRLYTRARGTAGLGNVTVLEYLDFGDCYSGMLVDGWLLTD